jgi:hypothetical protein
MQAIPKLTDKALPPCCLLYFYNKTEKWSRKFWKHENSTEYPLGTGQKIGIGSSAVVQGVNSRGNQNLISKAFRKGC